MSVQSLSLDGFLSSELGAHLADAERMLRTAPPVVCDADAMQFLKLHYGCDAQVRSLSGERDRNFLATGSNGWSGILKFYNSADDADMRALQNGVLSHVSTCSTECPVPEIIPSLQGHQEVIADVNGVTLAAILLTRLPGVSPRPEDCGHALRRTLGRTVGQLLQALKGYQPAEAKRTILWDMSLVAELRPLCALVENRARQEALSHWLNRFSTTIRPLTARLAHQTIHNDLSLSNILVDPIDHSIITGVIDFGDVVHAPRIHEFAIAASYFIGEVQDPIVAMADIIKGIGPELRLVRAEIALLPELVRARLATRILLSGWRAQLFPENRVYILRSNLSAWALWERLDAFSPAELSDFLVENCIGEFDEN